MKNLFIRMAFCVIVLARSTQAASDADVTLLKVKRVTIEDRLIVIVVEQARTIITLIAGDHDSSYKGDTWGGMPVTRVQVLSKEAIFTIKQDVYFKPGGLLEGAWQDCLAAARRLQAGKEVGRIGFYAPDIVIKGNMITSITGSGFLYAKGK